MECLGFKSSPVLIKIMVNYRDEVIESNICWDLCLWNWKQACLGAPELGCLLGKWVGMSGRLRADVGAMAAAPFGVVSGQGSMTGKRDTSSRSYARHTGQGKHLAAVYAQPCGF